MRAEPEPPIWPLDHLVAAAGPTRRPALVLREGVLSYKDLRTRVARLAGWLWGPRARTRRAGGELGGERRADLPDAAGGGARRAGPRTGQSAAQARASRAHSCGQRRGDAARHAGPARQPRARRRAGWLRNHGPKRRRWRKRRSSMPNSIRPRPTRTNSPRSSTPAARPGAQGGDAEPRQHVAGRAKRRRLSRPRRGRPHPCGAAAGVRLRAEPAVFELVCRRLGGAARLPDPARCGESDRAARCHHAGRGAAAVGPARRTRLAGGNHGAPAAADQQRRGADPDLVNGCAPCSRRPGCSRCTA